MPSVAFMLCLTSFQTAEIVLRTEIARALVILPGPELRRLNNFLSQNSPNIEIRFLSKKHIEDLVTE